jgi:hypothetical protein
MSSLSRAIRQVVPVSETEKRDSGESGGQESGVLLSGHAPYSRDLGPLTALGVGAMERPSPRSGGGY